MTSSLSELMLDELRLCIDRTRDGWEGHEQGGGREWLKNSEAVKVDIGALIFVGSASRKSAIFEMKPQSGPHLCV